MSPTTASAARVANDYYATDEEFIWACADALREEYKAIVDSGLILQLDDPAIAENWDQINPQPSVEDYQRFTMTRVEALNHAIRDLPADRIRFHLCWGSWHGPHTTDIPMRDIVRSEEHTSELQSRGHLVCRLLLEKKNQLMLQEIHLLD